MIVLPVAPITASAFAPYGWVTAGDDAEGRPVNDGTSRRVDGAGRLALDAEGGTPALAVFRAAARDPRGPWQTLERHRLGTQTFVPLGGVRCVMLVAIGEARPAPATLAAFVVSGRQAVTLHAGTWHHGLIAVDSGDFVVVERMAATVDCEFAQLAEAVTLDWRG
jgi:ureidoglycolate lyase